MRFINSLFLSVFVFMLIFPQQALAGDVVAKGTTLKEDSYVFTIDEATRLLKRVEELEAKEKELIKYKELEAVRLQQINLYKINLDYSQAQNKRYVNLLNINQDLIDKYNRRNDIRTWENVGFFALGMTLTVGIFFAADAITDQMEATGRY